MERGFPAQEFAARKAMLQAGLDSNGLDALLLTTPADIGYVTGFLTRFYESPTRPWFVIVPRQGDVVAVIPAIGEPLMRRCGVTDIRTWPAPRPADDGVSLLGETLREIAGPSGTIAIPSHLETHLRMPMADFEKLRADSGLTFGPDHGVMAAARAIKSDAEVAKIEHVCGIAGRAFDRVGEIARVGVGLDDVFRRFQMLCLEEGAEAVEYLAGGAGPFGYSDVISPATDTPLASGDVLMLDTGCVVDGYFCDYDRNFAIGQPDPLMRDAHARLLEATQAGFEAAKPGATAADLFHAMDAIVTGGANDPASGRLGHGLGMQLTEGCSLLPHDRTELRPGMVLTLEPGIATRDGNMLVHEENIVITDTGARPLTRFATTLPVLD
ncbi:Xaa-Pro peptidase family protein [Ahrensia sp. R2A130]|uniref:M24 family metallopeptidase n=1 Tax=Ahrensia sp. R2A130 TaxID=744979 RepID=UPI0001E08BF5|nr:Xaa-Pro peptidase family protein [Ahrensia sp. R2A130]EFL89957.1 peptidase M24 [Ahrensia sp. R2A130]